MSRFQSRCGCGGTNGLDVLLVWQTGTRYLEAEFLEEEFESGVLSLAVVQIKSLVLVFEVGLQVLSEGISGLRLGESVLGLLRLAVLGRSSGSGESLELGDDLIDTEFGLDVVSGRDEVVDVHVFDERLNFDPVCDALLRHVLVNSSWVSVDTSHQAVRVLSSRGG